MCNCARTRNARQDGAERAYPIIAYGAQNSELTRKRSSSACLRVRLAMTMLLQLTKQFDCTGIAPMSEFAQSADGVDRHCA
jgi:hypothetical protein